MNRAFIWGIFLLLLPMTLHAETKYVSEIREVSLRTGPGTEHKIIAMIKSGTAMTVVEAQEDWSHVRLEDGKDGWVLNRYLQTDATKGAAANQAAQDASATGAAPSPNTENLALQSKIDALTAEITRRQDEFNSLSTSYEHLKTDSNAFLELQEKYKALSEELTAQKERADRVETEFSSLYNKERLKWFVAGAGVLLVGVLLGFLTKPQRRRSSVW